jgi:hypothetical protein
MLFTLVKIERMTRTLLVSGHTKQVLVEFAAVVIGGLIWIGVQLDLS